MKLHYKESGFGGISLIIVTLVVVLIAAAGWILFDRQKSNQAVINTKVVNSFDECVAAGNPIMESYPEQCAADGKTFTNVRMNDSLIYLNERVESGKKSFSITFPDGWATITRSIQEDFFIIGGEKQPVVKHRAKPAIQNVDTHGGDGPSVFAVFIEENNDYKPQGEASIFSIGKGGSSLHGAKYTYVYVKDDQPGYIGGRLQNDRSYEYVFDLPHGKRLRAWYNVYGSDPANNIAVIEQTLQTISLN